MDNVFLPSPRKAKPMNIELRMPTWLLIFSSAPPSLLHSVEFNAALSPMYSTSVGLFESYVCYGWVDSAFEHFLVQCKVLIVAADSDGG